MPISTNLMAAAIAAPATLFVMSNVASATAQINGENENVKRTLYVTGGVLLASSIATGDGTIFLSTALALAAVLYLTYPIYFGEKFHVVPNVSNAA